MKQTNKKAFVRRTVRTVLLLNFNILYRFGFPGIPKWKIHMERMNKQYPHWGLVLWLKKCENVCQYLQKRNE